ncbi:MAG: gliding motility-associated protein GldE [Muribaculaceae bacterium]|nr:gliding motility-associated protein GldE [Muribaculaceae bacterium]
MIETPTQIVALVVACIALVLSGFISGSEIAFFSINQARRERLEESERGRRALKLLDKPELLLATVLTANNLVNVTIVVLTNFALGPLFAGMSPVLSFILQTVILTFLILLFGEIIPKLIANSSPERWVMYAVSGVKVLMFLCYPVARLLVSSTSIVHRVVTKQAPKLSADDLSQALELTAVEGRDDKDMLEGILEFGDTAASEIMTPRLDITGIETSASFDDVLRTVTETGYARLPVYDHSQDNIKGILYARDLLPYIGRDDLEAFDWHSLLRQPYYVPESRKIDDLLEDFRHRHIHMAIVVDEFGGTQGIVTMEDVLEEIVGDINDEYDNEEVTYKRLRDDTYIFEGRTLLTDFFRVTDLDPDDYNDVTDDCETLAGMLLAIKGDFPKDKEPLVYGRCRFLVTDMADHRIVEVRVKIMPEIQNQ